MSYLIQTEHGMCGDIALRHLLADIHGDDRYLLIKRRLEPHASLAAIARMADYYGVILGGYKVSSFGKLGKNDFPLIALVTENGKSHYVHIGRRTANKYLVKDGMTEPYRRSPEQLEAIFAGYVLTIGQKHHHRLSEDEFASITIPYRILNTVLFIISLVAVLLGLFLVDTTVRFYVPVMCFSIGAIAMIIQHRVLLSGMRHYDLMMKETYGHIGDWTALQAYYIHKRLSFSQPYAFIGQIVGVIGPAIFLVINDWRQLMYLAFVAAVAVFLHLASRKKTMTLHKSISDYESAIATGTGDEAMKRLNESTYRLSVIKTSSATIMVMTIALMALLYSALQGAVYLNFFLFHFYAYYLMATNIVKLLESGADRQQYIQLSYQLLIR